MMKLENEINRIKNIISDDTHLAKCEELRGLSSVFNIKCKQCQNIVKLKIKMLLLEEEFNEFKTNQEK